MRSLAFVFLLMPLMLVAQQGVTTFGIQIKPIIPLNYFDPLVEIEANENLYGSFELISGVAFGMSVRAGVSKSITLETGITQVRRRYDWKLRNDSVGFATNGSIRWTSYELPIRGLVYVQLGERAFMNNAIGISLDMYPSNVVSSKIDAQAFIYRIGWAQISIEGNVGVEFRTPKSGTFYAGATFHRPFSDTARGQLLWQDQAGAPTLFEGALNGGYLTLDFRYFFHEDPERGKRGGK